MEKQTDDPNSPMYPDKFAAPIINQEDPDSMTRDLSTFQRDGAFKFILLGLVIVVLIFAFIGYKLASTSISTSPVTGLGGGFTQEQTTSTTAKP